jgi:NAD-reducing hydrogenase large subunit
MVDGEGGLALYEGQIRLHDAQGGLLAQFDGRDYLAHVAERVEPWSFLKFPYYRGLGWPQGAYRVGPLARLNVADSLGTSLAGQAFRAFRELGDGGPVEGSLFYHHARLIENLYALERIGALLDDADILSKEIRAPLPARLAGEGVGVIEAPRGTLIHDYSTDEHGLLTRVNLIVATGHNNWAMNRAADQVARQYVNGSKLTEGVLNRVEAAIRCYDPCLSCSTHALGQMPLEVALLDASGAVLDRVAR